MDASAPAEQEGAGGRTFGGLTPREAALRRHAKRREAQAAAEAGETTPDDTRLVLVPVRVGGIVRRLEREAAAGDVQAARELRSWLDRYPQEDEKELDLAALTRQERQRILASILRELGDEAPAN